MLWSLNAELQVKTYLKRCIGYRWIYSSISNRYQSIDWKLSLVNIIIGPVITVMMTTLTDVDAIYAKVIVSTLGIVSGILAGVNKYLECPNTIFLAKSYLSRYSALANNIERQLLLPPEHREDPANYLSWLASKYDDLVSYEPSIDTDLVNEFIKAHSDYKQTEYPDAILIMTPHQVLRGLKTKEELPVFEDTQKLEAPIKQKKESPPSRFRSFRNSQAINNLFAINDYADKKMKEEISQKKSVSKENNNSNSGNETIIEEEVKTD
jgi:hypothetical protein